MRLTFVLPAPARVPQGGAAVVYRYAEGLAERGHEVTVVAPRRPQSGWRGGVWMAAVRVRDALHRVPPRDYYQPQGVASRTVWGLTGANVPDGDAVIATGVQTAVPVADLPGKKGRKVYLIQGDEQFADPDARQTWHLPLARITCAHWLRREIEASGERVEAVIPNAVDPAEFAVDQPVATRPMRVTALYHRHPVKGPDVLIAALNRVLTARPGTPVTVFSARPPSHRLPRGVDVLIRPTRPALRALFNRSAVFVHPSRSEGWSLATMEAAACGCAIAASSNLGVQEYLQAGLSMAAVPIGDGPSLGDAALSLLNNPDRRVRLAAAAREAVAAYSWQNSTDQLESALARIVGSTS